jgi:hypothetical protein
VADDRLLPPPRSGSFRRSFPLHSLNYARETIAEICSLRVALATAIISHTGSSVVTYCSVVFAFTAAALLNDGKS